MQSGPTSQELTPEDEVRTTRMPSIQPPPLPPFSPQQIYASLHTTPEKRRSSSWDTKPGAWWPSLNALIQGKKRSTLVATKAPAPQPIVARAPTILVTGSTIVVVSLFGTYLDLSLTPPGPRDGLAIALVFGRVFLALALAAFGWGLIRLGERVSARS